MRLRRLSAVALAVAVAVPVSLAPPVAAATSVATTTAAAAAVDPATRMPSEVPSKKTPWVLDGEVTKIVEVGDTMIAGGLFTQVTEPMNGTPYTRSNIVAWDKTTGVVSQAFNPTFDGQVQQLLAGPVLNGRPTVYVAGDFTKVNGVGPNHLQLLDVTTGRQVTSFKAPSTNGGIQTMELLPNNRLFIGGFFTRVGGVARGEMVTLNATTGAFDPYLDIDVAQRHNSSGAGVQAPIGPRESGVTPDGTRMVVTGNFKTAAGLPRDQIVMIELGATSAAVSTTWATTQYTPICSPNAFDSYMRDVEMSPDGSYFVVATTGGPHAGTLCDTATRWETNASGTTQLPTWTANSGGDTLWGVGITQAAVFVGGHNRWMNNPAGTDNPRGGAVPRPGLSALDPATGLPLKWNPGRNPRGEAAYELYPTADGLYLTSDTDWIGDRRYQRPRIAFFPYSEGSNVASTAAGSLPGNVYVASPTSTEVLYRVNAGGAAIPATDGGPTWAADTVATPSPNHNTGSNVVNQTALTSANLVNVPATTPLGIWTQERQDPSGGNEMQWDFPVAAGTSATVRLYFAARSTSTRRFNVVIDGVTKLSSYDGTSDPGTGRGTMKSFDVVSDGNLDIDFLHVFLGGNPQINAIEIIGSTQAAATAADVLAFDGTTVASRTATTTSIDWSTVRGAVMVGRSLFYGGTDNVLHKRSFDGVSFGEAVTVNPYNDPLWSSVETGSGAAGSTYNGAVPAWYSATGIGAITGMFYSRGRLYYTLAGSNALYWRSFVPDSGVVHPTQNTATGGNITWTSTKGMFLDGQNLYVVSSVDGSLSRISFVNGAPTGTATVVNSKATGGQDWRGKALFLASVLPNVAPSAAFTTACTGISCQFDSGTSSDSDGQIASYAWDFGDGFTSGEAAPLHEFAATGTYTVSLTVTDDAGLTDTETQQVSVVKPNVAPTAAFTVTCTYLDCSYDAGGSADSDGQIASYDWSFGDGTTGTGAPASHAFGAPGSYTATLTVTDDGGLTGTTTRTVDVVAAPVASTVTHVGSAVVAGNATTPNVTVPSAVSTGDRLVMVLSVAAGDRVRSAPTGVTGWTVLGTSTSTSMATTTYTKTAEAGDAGKKVTVPINLAAKYTMTVSAYSGARTGTVVAASLAETVNRAGHSTPVVTAPPGAWVVSYWADKTSTTTGFALPAGVTSRQAACAPTTGRVCSVLADSAGAVPAGGYGGLTATAKDVNGADSPTNNAATVSVVLRTVDPNVLPEASFTSSCDSLTCSFDASASTDTDGGIASYAWAFGDTTTGAGLLTSHDYPDDGGYEVTLTVTDDQGGQTSTTRTVPVVRTNAPPVAVYTTSCRYLVCSFDASGSTDDEVVASYAWDFGDGGTDTGAAPASHTFPASGTYQVSVTVTDNDGATTTSSTSVQVTAVRAIARVGDTVASGNVATPNTTVPLGVQAGDRLVMVLSLNATNRVQGTPTGTTGWTVVGTAQSGQTTGMVTTVYTKVAAAGDAGRVVRVPLDAAAKYTLTVAAYSGEMLAPTFLSASETVVRAGHTSPSTTVDEPAAEGDWAVSYWADRSSTTTGFVLPAVVVQREAACAPTTGRVCSVLADSDGPVAAGPYGGLVATADSAQSSATMWTILLRQVPATLADARNR